MPGNLAQINNDEPWRAFEGRVVGGKFTLQQWLGSSGHSAVFLTENDGKQAAIKIVPSDPIKAPRQLTLWRTATRLRNPHLLRILDMGRTQLDGTLFLFLVMEYAEEDLSQIIPERALTALEVEELLPALVDALSYLHQQGFAHGHVKPSNVHAIGNQPKLSTDQLILIADPSAERKRRDVYDAPEAPAGILSPASDVWSLGATLSAAFTQRAPAYEAFGAKDLRPADAIPEPFRSIVRDCLRHNPNQRCSLNDIEARLRPPARSVAAVDARAAVDGPGRSRLLTLGTAAALILGGIVLAYSCGRHRGASSVATQEPVVSAPAPAPSTGAQTAKPQTFTAEPAVASAPAAKSESAPASPADPTAKGATTQAGVVRQVIPTVSSSARKTITGKVRVSVRVDVDATGKVEGAKLASPGSSKYFANLALKAAETWEFSPPSVNGNSSPSAWMLKFSFSRTSTEVSPEQIRR